MAAMLGRSGQFKGVSIELPSGGLTLGRDKEGKGRLSLDQDTDVSREHCVVQYDGRTARFKVTDLGSSNGTFLMPGDRRLVAHDEVDCEPGQLIRVGPNNVFELTSKGASSARRWPAADPRNLLACMMVSVATLGAITTFYTAHTEQKTTLQQQRLIQAQLIALSEQKRMQVRSDLAREVHDLRSGAVALGSKLVDPHDGYLADMEFSVSRALYPLEIQFGSAGAGDAPPEQVLARSLASTLSSYGFNVKYSRASADDGDSVVQIWTTMKAAAARAHQQSIQLAEVVVAFVFALMMLTFSDVAQSPGWKRAFAAISATAVVMAFIGVLAIGAASLAKMLAVTAGVLALLIAALWHRGLLRTRRAQEHLSHPDEVEPPVHAFSLLRLSGETELFARMTIVAIAVTVMLSAGAGFGYSLSQANAGEAALEAADQSVQEIIRTDRWAHAYRSRATEVIKALDIETRTTLARQLVEYAQRFGSHDAMVALQPAYDDYRRRYLQASSSSKLVHDEADGIDADPRFPERILAHSATRGDGSLVPAMDFNFAFAMWDAHSTESTAWHTRATRFLAALTLFAIALYLFGQGHALGREAAGGALFLTGLLFVISASAIEASAVIPSIAGHRDEAAEPCASDSGNVTNPTTASARYYSRAMAKLGTAHSLDEASAASRLFGCALHFRPSFSVAREMLAMALARAGSIQDDDRYVNLPPRRRLKDLRRQDEQAVANFESQDNPVPTELLASVAYDRWLSALSLRDPGMAHSASSAIERAVADDVDRLDGGDAGTEIRAVTGLNSAVIHLTLEEYGAADQALKKAMHDEISHPERPGTTLATERPELIASMITDLNTLQANCPLDEDACKRVSARAEQMKRCAVAMIWVPDTDCMQHSAAATSFPSLQSKIEAQPARLIWRGVLPTPAVAPAEVRLIWLAYNEDWKTWRVLPESLSLGPVTGNKSELEGPDFVSARCYAPGKYAVEVYVDGKFAERQQTTLKGPPTRYRADHALNLGTCLAADLLPIATSITDTPAAAETNLIQKRAYGSKFEPQRPLLIFLDLPVFAGTARDAMNRPPDDLLRDWATVSQPAKSIWLTREKLESRCRDSASPADLVVMPEDTETGIRISAAITPGTNWSDLCSMMTSATRWMSIEEVKATSLKD